MNLFPIVSSEHQLTNAVMRLIGHDDFKLVIKYWEEVMLPGMYRDACGGNTGDRRDWFAGRASLLQDMIDDASKLRQRKTDFSARPTKVTGEPWSR